MRVFRLLACLTLLLISMAAVAEKNLQIYALALFPGANPSQHFPLVVDVQNVGPSTHGEVTLTSPDGTIHYPVDLPSHSRKEFIAYPSIKGMYEPLDVNLQTDAGSVDTEWDNPNLGGMGNQVLMITDQPGEINYLKQIPVNGASLGDIYGKPKLLPDRGIGYSGFWAVILGPGSERMSDEAVKALKEYVLLGGKLLFFGGASPQIVRDPRWESFLPVQNIHTTTLPSLNLNLNDYALRINDQITIATSDPIQGCDVKARANSIPILVTRNYGAGAVVFFAANPFEPPFRDIDTRVDFFKSLLGLQLVKGNADPADWSPPIPGFSYLESLAYANLLDPSLSSWAGTGVPPPAFSGSYTTTTGGTYSGGSYTTYRVVGPSTTTTTTGTVYMGSGTAGAPGAVHIYHAYPYPPTATVNNASPFSASLPRTNTVFEILLAYVVLVVPINLLILRRLKKGELAWLTAPVISILFGAVFFKYAGNLYSAALSKETTGIVVADSSSDNSYFLGRTQLFFPRGGGYDLKLQDVEFLGRAPENPMYGGYGYRSFGEQRALNRVNPVDIGQIIVPDLTATNLSFYDFTLGQKVSGIKWLTGHFSVKDGQIAGEVTNHSPYRIEDIEIGFGSHSTEVGSIDPGQTKGVSSSHPSTNVLGMYGLPHRLSCSGLIKGFRPGTSIGKEVQGSSVRLLENLSPSEVAE